MYLCSGSPVLVQVQLEREEEVTGPVIAPLFPQVSARCFCIFCTGGSTAGTIHQGPETFVCLDCRNKDIHLSSGDKVATPGFSTFEKYSKWQD